MGSTGSKYGSGTQVPIDPFTVHEKQGLSQRDEQQTFPVQKPDAHSASLWHVSVRCGRHSPLSHSRPAAQSLGAAQLVLQAPRVGSHVYGAQLCAAAGWQVPAPSQVRAKISAAPVQVGRAQRVPAT